jgi:uncharacterized lipoprotein YmbA
MSANRLVCFPLLSALLLPLTACIGGKTPPPNFYMLEPIEAIEREGSARTVQKPVVFLKSVRIPHYVDRPQIVTATGKNTYRLSEFHRWAESLDDNISRVLAQNLAILVPAEVNSSALPTQSEPTNFQVSVNILEFHTDPNGQAGLTAQWRITRGGDMLAFRQATYRAPASASDYHVIVEALNECLDRMSRDLAYALRRLADSSE